jgi:hypothetical protein
MDEFIAEWTIRRWGWQHALQAYLVSRPLFQPPVCYEMKPFALPHAPHQDAVPHHGPETVLPSDHRPKPQAQIDPPHCFLCHSDKI